MPDNLSISIGIDTAKLRADTEVMKKQLADATKEMREFGKGGNTAGLTEAAKNVDNLTRSIAVNQRVIREETRAIAGLGAAGVAASRGLHAAAAGAEHMEVSHGKAVREVTHLSKEIGDLNVNAFSVAKTFREFPALSIGTAALAGAALAMGKVADSAAKTVTSVQDLSEATGRSTNDILAMQKVFRDVNVDSAQVEPMLRKISEDFAKAHQSAAGMESAVSGVTVLRPGQQQQGGVAVVRGGQPQPSGFEGGGGVLVMRGGQPLQFDPTKGLAGLVDPSRFAATAAGQKQWQDAALKALQELNKTNHDLAMQVARAQLPGADPAQALRALLALGEPGRMPAAAAATAEEARRQEDLRKQAEQLQIAQKNAEAAKESAAVAVAPEAIPAATAAINAGAQSVETLGETWRKTMDQMNADWQNLATDVQKGLVHDQVQTDDFEAGWTGAIKGIASAWSSLVGFVRSTPLPSPSDAGGVQTPSAPPFATGGVVPGSGGGDTVPAWLTPGEYVARRASVDYYGQGVFRALNNRMLPRDLFSRIGYAMGGYVGPQSFAEGGMVGSAAGTPVHLHLGGNSYVTNASSSVAEALVREARSQAMRSAGIKPSWVS